MRDRDNGNAESGTTKLARLVTRAEPNTTLDREPEEYKIDLARAPVKITHIAVTLRQPANLRVGWSRPDHLSAEQIRPISG